jgi:VanZ family protein
VVNKKFLWLSLIYTLLIFFISLIPLPNITIPDFNLFQPDKLAHFLIYFIMLYLCLKSNSLKENKFRLKSLILVLFISSFIETLQGTSFIKRHYELADLIVNSVGILFSYIVFVLYPYKKLKA